MEETIFELNGKQYKALMEFVSKKARGWGTLTSPFVRDGKLYATDSFRVVRITRKDGKVYDGAFMLGVEASRLKVGDTVDIATHCTHVGTMRFEHDRDLERNLKNMVIDRFMEVEGAEPKAGYGFNPDYVASLAKLAKAFNGALEFRFSGDGKLYAEVINEASPLKVEAIVMPIRFAKKEK